MRQKEVYSTLWIVMRVDASDGLRDQCVEPGNVRLLRKLYGYNILPLYTERADAQSVGSIKAA